MRFFRQTFISPGLRLPFKHSGSEIHLMGVRVNRKKIVANLDTGANSAFQITPNGIRKLNLATTLSKAKSPNLQVSMEVIKSRTGKLLAVDIGSIHVSNPEASFWAARHWP